MSDESVTPSLRKFDLINPSPVCDEDRPDRDRRMELLPKDEKPEGNDWSAMRGYLVMRFTTIEYTRPRRMQLYGNVCTQLDACL